MTITYPNRWTEQESSVSLNLDKGALIDLQPPMNGVKIQVESGSLWVTQEGDASDHVIGPGESFVTAGRGLIVVQALRCSAFRVPGQG
ncbi:DUF2917 domain-containing protein [Fimbriimonas ginsengisoli]|uniref:DUF2917 domain-containing protein n=1 Tax=Fimbriimonas ginsengisoli Gsoil 348 TaxID=661478 RepID=A0A068NJ82_FIMGI|nr:DUF2917 domain-containing protein [Fimbriimonas ginsengisoli]AIE83663.1 hypothetical protein OP10G_0295 [Fimbriimonas ginsengisoli Gsoil 348]